MFILFCVFNFKFYYENLENLIFVALGNNIYNSSLLNSCFKQIEQVLFLLLNPFHLVGVVRKKANWEFVIILKKLIDWVRNGQSLFWWMFFWGLEALWRCSILLLLLFDTKWLLLFRACVSTVCTDDFLLNRV